MGLCPSPYVSIREMLWLKEESHTNPSYPENVCCWERVELNLPGHEDYRTTSCWLACGARTVPSIVDDFCPTGLTEADARQASQVMTKQAAWRGIQDATCKQRDVSQTPGAWAGSVVHTSGGNVSTMVE